MEALFLKVLNMSLAASWLILAVTALRICLKKVPRWIICLLWALAGVRLVCPFSVRSALSLIPSAEVFNAHNIQYETPQVYTGFPAADGVVNPALQASFAPDPFASVNPLYVWMFIAGIVWAAGIAALLLYAALSSLRVYRTVREAALLRGNIYLCDAVPSPFILGLAHPRIFLPSNITPDAMEPVIAHEQAHLARRDHWWKPLGYLILTVHWFNPLCWLAYALLCRDIELACDERAVRALDLEGKKAYSAALLACSVRRPVGAVCPLAFGEIGVRQRVKSVLRYKKPALWTVVAGLAVCAAAAVCFLTDPQAAEPDLSLLNYKNAAPVAAQTGQLRAIYCPDTGPAGDGVIVVGYADGNALARYLDLADWQECAAPGQEPAQPGSVEFLLQDDYRVTVYRSPARARVICGGQSRWYWTQRADYEAAAALFYTGQSLTLEDVVRLASKGEALDWADFAQYAGVETGFGLYIMVYPIDDLFSLRVGGVPDETPRYIHLQLNTEAGDYIDIRTGDVPSFVAAHRSDEPAADAQQSFAQMLDVSERTRAANGEAWMRENMPYGWMLLQMKENDG